jgi:2-polyprenyl-3-methyl-5-hydroxy-6-metoxy-1,4-benzoquinol methylase
MASRYYERIWRAVPDDGAPDDLQLRLAFVLERLRGAGQPATDAPVARTDTVPAASPDTALAASRGRPLRVLDVGCGEAQIAAELARSGFDVLGIDIAEEPLRRARRSDPRLDVRLVDEIDWELDDASFDAVWSGETIEHVLDTIGWLSEVRRVLRSGGQLLLSTPAHGPLSLLAAALSPRVFERRFDARSDHVRFYNRRALARLLADFGFEQIDVRGVGGAPGARRVLLASAVRSRF